jgi:hypothetical protein
MYVYEQQQGDSGGREGDCGVMREYKRVAHKSGGSPPSLPSSRDDDERGKGNDNDDKE